MMCYQLGETYDLYNINLVKTNFKYIFKINSSDSYSNVHLIYELRRQEGDKYVRKEKTKYLPK